LPPAYPHTGAPGGSLAESDGDGPLDGSAPLGKGRRPWPVMMMVGALGVVFGDIGTSPLYALPTAFNMEHNAVAPVPHNVYGIISMVLWTITLIVTVKYVLLVTRADNDGQGGILALLALLQHHLRRPRVLVLTTAAGILGAALFFGDAVTTPAISVLSAVEGLSVVSADLGGVVVPLAAVVLAALFAVQPFGTRKVARAFGPMMAVWFLTLAGLGLPQIVNHPQILISLSPHWALELLLRHPLQAFILLGAVVLTVTGAEALYADLGHFHARAVRLAWLLVAMPALALVYLGQGALVISTPEAVANPFFYLAPPALQIPLVILATTATIIASQAVISGAFSATHQAIRLGLLPRLVLKHTSRTSEGQIYLPAINWALFGSVMALVVLFSSSTRLASAYGLAVTGTLVLVSALFLLFAATVWGWRWWKLALYGVLIGVPELLLLGANSAKVFAGGWITLLVAGLALVTMITWRDGYRRMTAARRAMEGPLAPFVASLPSTVRRIPGVAVFPHPDPRTTPLALSECVRRFGILHEHVLIVRLAPVHNPHVPPEDRILVDAIGSGRDGVVHVTILVGFTDSQDVPRNLALAVNRTPELRVDLSEALYFLSVLTVHPMHTHRLRDWRRILFLALERNQANRSEVFRLPPTRTILLGEELQLG